MIFSKQEMEFLLNEGNLEVNENETRKEILSQAWEIAADIEIEEAANTTDEEYEANGDCLNDRGMMAVSLVDKLCWRGYREGEVLHLDRLTEEMFEFMESEIGLAKKQILTLDKNEELRQQVFNKLSELGQDEETDEEGNMTSRRGRLIDGIENLLIYRPETMDMN